MAGSWKGYVVEKYREGARAELYTQAAIAKDFRHFTRSELTVECLRQLGDAMLQRIQLHVGISGLMAGFSLGAAVTMLFVEHSALVSVMLAASLLASGLFVISVLFFGYAGDVLIFTLSLRDRFRSPKAFYSRLRSLNRVGDMASVFSSLGWVCFIVVLACGTFFLRATIAIGIVTVCGVLIILALLRIGSDGAYDDDMLFKWTPWCDLPDEILASEASSAVSAGSESP